MNKRFWVEVRISYDGVLNDGETDRITETWLVRAATFAEAEARAIEEVSEYDNVGNVDVEACTKRNIAAVWVDIVDDEHSKWYKSRCEHVTVNEKTGKEKRCKRDYLIFAPNICEAYHTLRKCMKDNDYDGGVQVLGLNLTSITEVLSDHD